MTPLLMMAMAVACAVASGGAADTASSPSLCPCPFPCASPSPAPSPKPPPRVEWGGGLSLKATPSGGTSRQNFVTGSFAAFRRGGLLPTSVRSQTNLRGELSYGTSQKGDAPKVKTSEWMYGELRQAFGARPLFGSRSPRIGEPHLWVYAVASGFHNINFGLRSEQAYGVGGAYHFKVIPGLALGGDLRHIKEVFDGQSSFSSWAVRIQESYSKSWEIGPKCEPRYIVFTESFEIVPAFESGDALQTRAYLRLILPITAGFSIDSDLGSDYMKNVPSAFKAHFWKSNIGVTWNFGAK